MFAFPAALYQRPNGRKRQLSGLLNSIICTYFVRPMKHSSAPAAYGRGQYSSPELISTINYRSSLRILNDSSGFVRLVEK
jgi:hypothetical protein